MKTEELNAPLEIRAAIARFRDELLSAADANLAGLVLYGGLARGRGNTLRCWSRAEERAS